MSPARVVTINGETKLQLTFGSVVTLAGTLLVHAVIVGGFSISIDRRFGALENSVGKLGEADIRHEKAIDRIETKLFPTATIQGAQR